MRNDLCCLSVLVKNLFDEMFDDPFELMPMFSRHNPLYGKHAKALMKTDVREKDNSYELDIDLPGFKKDEIQAQISDGYLTISASKGLDKDQKDDKGPVYPPRAVLRRMQPELLYW